MKILITGAKGMLGLDLVRILSMNNEVIGISRTDADISRWDIVELIINKKPDIVIHSAAYTDVDGCEINSDLAMRINAIGTRNVAIGCQEINARMIYISTDYVFDGSKKSPYLEYDNTNPVNHYGITKLAGEYFVQHILNRYLIIRTSWLFGKDERNFINYILETARKEKIIRIINDNISSPTYSLDLSFKIMEILKSGLPYGIYHITNRGSCTRYEQAIEILKCCKIYDVKIIPINSSDINRPAKRPEYSVLENLILKLDGFEEMRDFKESMKEYISKFILN